MPAAASSCAASACRAGAATRRDLRVDARAHEAVDEVQRASGTEDPRVGEAVGDPYRGVALDPGQRSSDPQVRPGTEDGHGLEQGECVGSCGREAGEDPADDGGRRQFAHLGQRARLGRAGWASRAFRRPMTRNGLPPVTSWQASAKAGSADSPRCPLTRSATAAAVNGCNVNTRVEGSDTSRSAALNGHTGAARAAAEQHPQARRLRAPDEEVQPGG